MPAPRHQRARRARDHRLQRSRFFWQYGAAAHHRLNGTPENRDLGGGVDRRDHPWRRQAADGSIRGFGLFYPYSRQHGRPAAEREKATRLATRPELPPLGFGRRYRDLGYVERHGAR